MHNIGTQNFLQGTSVENINTGSENFSYIIGIGGRNNYSEKLLTFPFRKSMISKSRGSITSQPDFLESRKVAV